MKQIMSQAGRNNKSNLGETSSKDTNKEIKQKGGYTIEFWLNIGSRTQIPSTNEVLADAVVEMLRVLFLACCVGVGCFRMP